MPARAATNRCATLLGADHITDIDQYLVDDDTYGNLLQNDLRHPGRTVREGDRFGYDYALSTREATVRLSAEYRSDRLRADVALALGDAVVLRRGYYEKELFPGTQSLGALAADGVYALYGQGTGGVGFLAPQLPRSIGRSRGCGADARRPVLPAVV